MGKHALRQPFKVAGHGAADKTDMTACSGKFELKRGRDLVRLRQCGGRQKGIVARIDDECGHCNPRQPRLAARASPVIVGVAETM